MIEINMTSPDTSTQRIREVVEKLIKETGNGNLQWTEKGGVGFKTEIFDGEVHVEKSVLPGKSYAFSIENAEADVVETYRFRKVKKLYDVIVESRKPDNEWINSWTQKVLSNYD